MLREESTLGVEPVLYRHDRYAEALKININKTLNLNTASRPNNEQIQKHAISPSWRNKGNPL